MGQGYRRGKARGGPGLALAVGIALSVAACGASAPAVRPPEVPRAPEPPPLYREVTTGRHHSCAVTTDGRVACWGGNAVGQVGDGTTRERLAPVWVDEVEGAVDVDAGAYQTCALLAGGRALCWGGGRPGVAGTSVAPLEGLRGVIRAIAVGRIACALDLRGRTACWDSTGPEGAMGAQPPTFLPTAEPADSLDVGVDLLCQLSGPSDVQCFSIAEEGAADGQGLVFRAQDRPAVRGARQLAVSGGHACITGHGRVFCWGNNDHGQLGSADPEASAEAVEVTLADEAMHVTTGWSHSCAVTANGSVWCWGDNALGQLGDGTTDSSHEPRQVVGLDEPAIRVAAGMAHTCVVTIGRRVLCWGHNDHGQLGDGSRTERLRPVPLARPAPAPDQGRP